MVSHESLALLTDLYQLTMAQAYSTITKRSELLSVFYPILSAKQRVFHFCRPA